MAYEDVIAAIEASLAEQPTPGEEQAAVQSGVPIARYVAGMTSVDQLEGELSALGYKGIRRTRLMLAAQLKRELELFNDRLAIKRQEVRDKIITLSQFTTWLELSGIDGEGVALEVSRAAAAVPAPGRESVEVSLRILDIEEVPARPMEQPVALGIRIIEAAAAPAAPAAGVQSLALSLRFAEVQSVQEVPVQSPVLYLDIIKIEEVPLGS